ncbi:AMP-binding protein [Szabonella alba]|uniref:3-methylmercaptopropionyl-CoA ligase n=1 Tax=Szabonella alba TaxID=2804194 RepID=A0A8K0Y2C7_9RHOB|nr:AMP-binding protein [Szabonella alba]MBL4919127.1 AMP-binding protein [Szabonella alba]
MNIVSFLKPLAQLHHDLPALSLGDHPVASYGALAGRVAALAGALQARLGARPGDRVGLAMKNAPEYVEIKLACWHAGLCVVPINAKLHPREMIHILKDCGAAICFADTALATGIEVLRQAAPALTHLIDVEGGEISRLRGGDPVAMQPRDPQDPAWIFYTSGTTGTPKGATLSHRNLMMMSLLYYADIDQVDPRDSYVHAAPISHGGGLYGLPHMMKGSHIIVPPSRGFDADELFDLTEQHTALTFFAAPTMLMRMVAHPRARSCRTDSFRTIYYGGAPMYLEDMKRALSAFGPCFYQVYGQGESPMTGAGLSKADHADSGHPRFEARLASTGRARTGVGLRIMDDKGHEMPPGETGEVLFRSDAVMLGYWNNPTATAETLRDGWLHTGDIGTFDADGYVTLKDRSKDMIISGGTNIYPREIEEILLTHPGVREVSVVGRRHPDWGEEPVAFIVAAPDNCPDPAALDRLCLDAIARFKRPKHYVFIDELPKSAYGKVLKTILRAGLLEDSQDS